MALPVINRLAANGVLLVHFVFVVLAVIGAVGVIVIPAWAWIHVPMVVWSSVVNLAGWTCPLTPLENRFRAAATGKGYEGGFIEHYIGPLVYPRGMPRRLELIAGVTIVLWNGILYGGILWWFSRCSAAS
jgi:Protein of Unknown function (DUF2784)